MFTVVITRPPLQARGLVRRIKGMRLQAIFAPSLEIRLAPKSAQERTLLARFASGEYAWIVFTSANGVTSFAAVLRRNGFKIALPAGVRCAVVGAATGACVREVFGVTPALRPAEYVAEALAAAFRRQRLKGQRVLVAGAAKTRAVIERALRQQGARVRTLAVYESVPLDMRSATRRRILGCPPGRLVVMFFSPSAVRGFLAGLRAPPDFLAEVHTASIGPVTSRALRACGLNVTIEARDHSQAGLLRALAKWARRSASGADTQKGG